MDWPICRYWHPWNYTSSMAKKSPSLSEIWYKGDMSKIQSLAEQVKIKKHAYSQQWEWRPNRQTSPERIVESPGESQYWTILQNLTLYSQFPCTAFLALAQKDDFPNLNLTYKAFNWLCCVSNWGQSNQRVQHRTYLNQTWDVGKDSEVREALSVLQTGRKRPKPNDPKRHLTLTWIVNTLMPHEARCMR